MVLKLNWKLSTIVFPFIDHSLKRIGIVQARDQQCVEVWEN